MSVFYNLLEYYSPFVSATYFIGFAPLGSRNRYRLHVIGSHHNAPTLYGKGSHELVLMTYDSRADAWIFGSVVGRCRFSKSAGKTGMASISEGFLLGGQEETDEVVMVKIEEDHQPKKKKNAYKVYGSKILDYRTSIL